MWCREHEFLLTCFTTTTSKQLPLLLIFFTWLQVAKTCISLAGSFIVIWAWMRCARTDSNKAHEKHKYPNSGLTKLWPNTWWWARGKHKGEKNLKAIQEGSWQKFTKKTETRNKRTQVKHSQLECLTRQSKQIIGQRTKGRRGVHKQKRLNCWTKKILVGVRQIIIKKEGKQTNSGSKTEKKLSIFKKNPKQDEFKRWQAWMDSSSWLKSQILTTWPWLLDSK